MLSDAPHDVALTIVRCFDLPSLGRAAAVCRGWSSVCLHETVWRERALDAFEEWPFDVGAAAVHEPLFFGGWRAAFCVRSKGRETCTTQAVKQKSAAARWMEGGTYRPRKKRENIPGAPKSPLTAYFLFCAQLRANGMLRPSELQAAWRQLDERERQEWKRAAVADRARWEVEKGLWALGISVDEAQCGRALWEAIAQHYT